MKSLDALRVLAPRLGGALVVCCNGFPSRELYSLGDRPEQFYMIGSMGLAAPIGMGVALARPGRRVVVLDGDGNALMALGAMANVGAAQPRNLVHVVLDNGTYASTGAQRTVSKQVALEKVAASCGYAETRRVADPEALRSAWEDLSGRPGPACLLVEVEPTSGEGLPRVEVAPPALARRFREASGIARSGDWVIGSLEVSPSPPPRGGQGGGTVNGSMARSFNRAIPGEAV